MSAFQLGLDRSGNANHFNVAGINQHGRVIDTPTNNFSTMNPHPKVLYDRDGGSLTFPAGNPTYSEGNLEVVTPNSGSGNSVSTIGVESGKWYAEVYIQAYSSLPRHNIGITGDAFATILAATNFGSLSTSLDVGYFFNGTKFIGNSESTNAGATYAVGDVMGIALNVDDSAVTFYKNNASQFTQAFTAGGTYHFVVGDVSGGGGTTFELNFGQDSSFGGRKTPGNKQDGNSIGDFFYAPPAGFLALCTKNLPEPAVVPTENFNSVLYTGTGQDNRAVTGVGFQPDWVFIKGRTSAESTWHDSLRGPANGLFAESETAEDTGGNLVSFDADGFTTSDSNRANRNNQPLIAWNWKAGGNAASVGSNTDGSINTTDTSVNSAAGFSISTFTGNATSGATVGHGLGVVPEWVMVVCRSSAGNRLIYHASNTSAPATDYLALETTGATADAANIWNDTAPTSSVFSLGNNASANGNGETFVAYCWHSVEGYSKFGSYTGNGNADGPFVHLGFKPAFIMRKRTDNTTHWHINDNARIGFNGTGSNLSLRPNVTDGEDDANRVDFLSNGFKISTTSGDVNNDNSVFIFMAFAESPFKYSNAR